LSQQNLLFKQSKPKGWLRLFFKFPVFLHRLGLGGWERWIGAEWMLLTTMGRKSGKPRQAMVDVMGYDRASDTYYIEAAYGERADWYRNIQAQPVFSAQVGRRKFQARAARLAPEPAGETMVDFYRRKPAYTRAVMRAVGMTFKGEDELRELGKQLLLLAVKPIPVGQWDSEAVGQWNSGTVGQ
jgi:deazaflavin-dependent oxidoreductase (nitroreductase family)